MLEIGSLVDGKYKILNKVGQGGMSVVYLAMNERANKQWAVKEVRKDGVLDFESVKQGLVAETDILKKLSHPYLPSIVDVIDTDDSFIIIMDYVQGNSLDKALKEFGAQRETDVIEWAKMLCDVLGYLHTREPAIIYRDMKPANVMLKPDGTISLIDFGTAREHKAAKVEDTTCLGTRGYAAPEQYGGMGQTDARTDIYCLGATIYHLVTGMNPSEPPYEIRPIRDINPALSPGLEKIILKCTQNDPNQRYQSCAELRYALETYMIDDEAVRKQLKKKISLFVTSCALSVVFAITSVVGFFAAESSKKANYDYLVSSANSTDKYYEAIFTDPTRKEAYLGTEKSVGFIRHLIEDNDGLSSDDHKEFEQLKIGLQKSGSGGYDSTVDVMQQFKKNNREDYAEVCYKLGEAYLFYYDVGVEKDKYEKAAYWFNEAVEEYPVSQIYCNISNCLQSIFQASKKQKTAELYEAYEDLWNEVGVLYDAADAQDDDMKLHIWNEIVSMVNNNCKEFCSVASQTELNSLLNGISSEADKVTNGFLDESVKGLKKNIETTLAKVAVAQEG